jgi:hypothetical protein
VDAQEALTGHAEILAAVGGSRWRAALTRPSSLADAPTD